MEAKKIFLAFALIAGVSWLSFILVAVNNAPQWLGITLFSASGVAAFIADCAAFIGWIREKNGCY